MERHAEEERKEHDRGGVALRQPVGGERDRAGGEQARIDGVDELSFRQRQKPARRRRRLDRRDPFHAVERGGGDQARGHGGVFAGARGDVERESAERQHVAWPKPEGREAEGGRRQEQDGVLIATPIVSRTKAARASDRARTFG